MTVILYLLILAKGAWKKLSVGTGLAYRELGCYWSSTDVLCKENDLFRNTIKGIVHSNW